MDIRAGLVYFFLLAFTVNCSRMCKQGANCHRPKCSCFTTDPPENLKSNDLPQFVMLTYDDDVNVVNQENTYAKLFMGNKMNNANGCNIAATFFLSHEYTNYQIVNELRRHGNEIAVHSITHLSDVERWKKPSYETWKDEMVGMRTIISTFANISKDAITGCRAPFLQTAGDTTFQMLQKEGFLYDSSMPTRQHSNPPAWPYTLDYGYKQDCQILPCPEEEYPGLWEVPMVVYYSTDKDGFTCSMADACTPYPETAEETFEFFRVNFERHYDTNRAPFPVFLHEAWIKNDERYKGYMDFINWLLQKDDVYLVTVQTVIDYMKNPVSKYVYKQTNCVKKDSLSSSSCENPKNCHYKNLEQLWNGERYMMSCVAKCPEHYPWLGNHLGN